MVIDYIPRMWNASRKIWDSSVHHLRPLVRSGDGALLSSTAGLLLLHIAIPFFHTAHHCEIRPSLMTITTTCLVSNYMRKRGHATEEFPYFLFNIISRCFLKIFFLVNKFAAIAPTIYYSLVVYSHPSAFIHFFSYSSCTISNNTFHWYQMNELLECIRENRMKKFSRYERTVHLDEYTENHLNATNFKYWFKWTSSSILSL